MDPDVSALTESRYKKTVCDPAVAMNYYSSFNIRYRAWLYISDPFFLSPFYMPSVCQDGSVSFLSIFFLEPNNSVAVGGIYSTPQLSLAPLMT